MRKCKIFILIMLLLLPTFMFGCKSHTIKFDTKVDELKVSSARFSNGEVFVLPSDPQREGFTFEGWYLDDSVNSYTKRLTSDYFLINYVDSDLVAHARWLKNYNVNFVTSGTMVSSLNTGIIEFMPQTIKVGYKFAGWYVSDVFDGNPIEFPFYPTDNITLYAKFVEESKVCEISFQDNNGKILCGNIIIEKNGKMKFYESLIKPGYTIDYWINKADNTVFDTETMIQNNITLMPHYKGNEYVVTLNFGEYSDYVNVPYLTTVVQFGQEIGSLPTPKIDNKEFAGWFIDENFSTPFNVGQKYNYPNDMTIYAKYI